MTGATPSPPRSTTSAPAPPPPRGKLVGSGRYLTRDSLAAAGLTPGATVTHDPFTFTWPVELPANGNIHLFDVAIA